MQEIALYLRLSKVDSDKSDRESCLSNKKIKGSQSESILNQKKLLLRFVERDKELSGFPREIYTDDGFSGTDEKRPALQMLLKRISEGRVKAVVVKDFSRLARNYLFLARFREQICPKYQIILISLGDWYDSRESDYSDLCMRFKSVFYEYYSRDISRKVKTSLEAKKKGGDYAVAKPPYGYDLDKEHRWCICKMEAESVQRIFQRALEGVSQSENAMLEQKIIQVEDKEIRMYPVKVHRILRNPVYCGYQVWHKYENHIGLERKTQMLSKQEWQLQKGIHPSLVEERDFWKINTKNEYKIL